MQHNQKFKYWLQNRLESSLPGENAQYKLAPLKRKEEEVFARDSNIPPRPSSVMMILYPLNSKTHVPMIVRNEYKGVHSGQVALPGGKYENDDEDIMFTAIRETNEEINVNISRHEVIGKLSHLFVPVSNFIIHPYIAWLDQKPNFVPDQTEVQSVLEVPLKYLANPKNITSRSIETASGFKINAPGIPIENHFLWGATAMMMSEFFTLIQEYES